MADIFAHLHHDHGADDATTHHATADHGGQFSHDHVSYDHTDTLGEHTAVPWLNFGTHHTHQDTDHGDAVANAAHASSCSSDHPIGAFSSGVPWQQLTPDAMHHDSDGDGIPDALDNHVGPGA